MSVQYMHGVWKRAEYDGSKLLLLLAIADHANDDGVCWPSNPHLAKKCRLSVRHTQRLISELVTEKALLWIQGGGRGIKRVLQVSPFFVGKGDTGDAEKVTPVSQKGDARVAPSLINHQRTIKNKPSIINGEEKEITYVDIGKEFDKPKSKKKFKGKHRAMVKALSEVCEVDANIKSNWSWLGKTAKELVAAGRTPVEVIEKFGASGTWYKKDWRGQKGQKPNPAVILQTIEQLEKKDYTGGEFAEYIEH